MNKKEKIKIIRKHLGGYETTQLTDCCGMYVHSAFPEEEDLEYIVEDIEEFKVTKSLFSDAIFDILKDGINQKYPFIATLLEEHQSTTILAFKKYAKIIKSPVKFIKTISGSTGNKLVIIIKH